MGFATTISVISYALIIWAVSLSPVTVESRIAPETTDKVFKTQKQSTQGTKWAVLVAGSNGYSNYRHQADICHAYQILKAGGLKEENIVVLMYDDIAGSSENPKPGTIINKPNGTDVYKGVPKDYTGKAVTAKNLLAVILGDKKSVKGGSGKVVDSGPNDQIFIYYSDHGSPGLLSMPVGDDLYAKDFIETLKKKHAAGTYKSMVLYIEACEAGSIFDGLLPKGMNIYVTTASNPSESSWATYCPGSDSSGSDDFNTCLGDLYSVAWMEDTDQHSGVAETLQHQYEVVKKRTLAGGEEGSHVMQYGDNKLATQALSLYIGTTTTSTSKKKKKHHGHAAASSSDSELEAASSSSSTTTSSPVPVEQREADILYLKDKAQRAPAGSIQKIEAQKELDAEIAHRYHVDTSINAIGQSLFGQKNGPNVLNTVRPSGQPLVDDWDCLKSMVNTYQTHCGSLSTYGLKYMRAFANICNAGVHQDRFTQASVKACS